MDKETKPSVKIDPISAYAILSPQNKILLMNGSKKFAKHHFTKEKMYDWRYYESKGYRCVQICITER